MAEYVADEIEQLAASPPMVTVVIPTRDRGDSVVMALRTVLRSDHPAFDVHVVDQSKGDATEVALEQLPADPRVRYTRSATVGLSAALNCGISEASGELIAITGDDCEVDTKWLRELMAPLVADARIGVVFGSVLPGPHDASLGFIPACVQNGAILARGIHEAHLVGGTTASMALRKGVWDDLGGFDEMLGVGSPLQAAEDLDVAIRALLRGHCVYQTPRAEVVHQGFFRWDERRTLVQRNWYGTGAAFAKSLRQGGVRVLPGLARLGERWLVRRGSPVTVSLGRPHRGAILAAFMRGFAAGLITAIDRDSGHYRPRRVPRGLA